MGALWGNVLFFSFGVFRVSHWFRRNPPLIRSSVPAWSRSELVNVGFGPNVFSMFGLGFEFWILP